MDLNTARQPGSNASAVPDQLLLAISYWQNVLATSTNGNVLADANVAVTLLQAEYNRMQSPTINHLGTVVPV